MDFYELSRILDSVCKPLSPVRRPADAERYLDLDSSALLYKRFQDLFETAGAVTGHGHLIIVDGETGSGKTSLVNRCAYWLGKQMGDRYFYVPFLEKLFAETDTTARLNKVFLRALEVAAPNLDPDTVASLRKRLSEEDAADAFGALGRALCAAANPRPLIVLMPAGGTAAEVFRLAEAAGPGLVFFTELNDTQEAKKCADRYGTYLESEEVTVLQLTLGALRSGDAVRLVESIHEAETKLPTIPDEIVQYIEKKSNTTKSAKSVTRLAYGVRHVARDNGQTQVEFSDVTNFLDLVIDNTIGGLG